MSIEDFVKDGKTYSTTIKEFENYRVFIETALEYRKY